MIDPGPIADRIIRLALDEDLGRGDMTTEAVIDPSQRGEACLIAREEIILAGMPVFWRVFSLLDADTAIQEFYRDGDRIPPDATVCLLRGRLAPILQGERTALNFLQRMSGIATLTRRYVDRVAPYPVKILDTRKTAPGLRWFDKHAVRAGGGFNHRFGLSDGILIKDNHIAAAGSIAKAVQLAKEKAPHSLRIEVEVEDLAGAEEACRAGADIVLLDNMPPEQLARAVKIVKGAALLEASGGITLETIRDVAESGVDMISVGALTHSPRAADFSLEIRPKTDGMEV